MSAELVRELLGDIDRGSSAMAPYPEVGGNRVTVYGNVPDFYDDLRGELQKPHRSINIAQYAWYRNGFGKEATKLVEEQLRNGADVATTTDMFGTRGKLGSFQQARLRRAGAEVAESRPWNSGALADHRKLMVFDGRTMFMTGVGLGRKYESRWADLGVRIDGPAAAWGQAEHLARLRDMGGNVSEVQREVLADALRNPVEQGRASAQLLVTRPGGPFEIADHADQVIGSRSKDPLYVATSFLVDEERVGHLVDAAQRGREVNIVTTPLEWKRQVRQFFPDAVSRTHVNRLINGGVNVISPAEFFHAKALYGGGDTFKTGSANFANSSFSKFYELDVVIKGPGSSAQIQKFFDGHIAAGRPVDAKMFANPVDGALRALVGALKIKM